MYNALKKFDFSQVDLREWNTVKNIDRKHNKYHINEEEEKEKEAWQAANIGTTSLEDETTFLKLFPSSARKPFDVYGLISTEPVPRSGTNKQITLYRNLLRQSFHD